MAENVIKFTVEFSNEMLEQIRAVVREEIQAALNKDDSSTVASSSDGTISGTIFQDGKLTELGKQVIERANQTRQDDSLPVTVVRNELTSGQQKKIVEDVKQSIARNIRLSSGRTGF